MPRSTFRKRIKARREDRKRRDDIFLIAMFCILIPSIFGLSFRVGQILSVGLSVNSQPPPGFIVTDPPPDTNSTLLERRKDVVRDPPHA